MTLPIPLVLEVHNAKLDPEMFKYNVKPAKDRGQKKSNYLYLWEW